jgi:hypothetical protein
MTGKDEATLEKRKAVIKTSMELRRALRATERAIKAAKVQNDVAVLRGLEEMRQKLTDMLIKLATDLKNKQQHLWAENAREGAASVALRRSVMHSTTRGGSVLDSRLMEALGLNAIRSGFTRRRSMPTFIMTGTWTDQGIRAVKDAPKRAIDRFMSLWDWT